jgi:hypothetical protein
MSFSVKTHSESTPDRLIIIRHAGYLLKRSNFPYAMNSNAVIVATDDLKTPTENGTDSILEPPLIENVVRDFPLPDLNQLTEGSEVTLEGGFGEIFDVVENSRVRGIEAKECNEHERDTEDVCFCAPIIQYFETLFGKRKAHNAIVSTDKNIDTVPKTSITSQTPTLPMSPRRTQPLPIASSAASSPSYLGSQSSTLKYNMPLKAPARSTPVPISPQITRTGSTSKLSARNQSSKNLTRSYSNGSRLNIAAMAGSSNGTNNNEQKKEKETYPPLPEDYIDPKDGHIWRAKYCVLENGILFFYRNAEEGESDEAQEERNESKLQSLDAMEGTGFDYESNSPNRPPITRGSSNGFGISGKTWRTESRQDLTDLSKSPMPYKKSDIFEFTSRRSGSSLSESQSNTLQHSHSANTFTFDSDILWEKRVALDCVGAVRSSEQDYGDHAFELLAFGMVGRTDEMSDSFSGKSQNQIVDRLILRAGTSDDMNNWMFQFHRSLASYMQRIVQQHNRNSHRPDSPILHRRLPTPIHGGKGFALSPFGARQSSSPTTNNSFGGSLTASNIPGSLSHGHGRNALYRRQVRDHKNDDVLLISPVSTPGGGSSPVDATIQSTTLTKTHDKLAVPLSLKNDAAPSKYIPPHLRNKNGPKYIPPHLRRKTESMEIDAYVSTLSPPQLYEEPLIDGEKDNTSDQGNDSYSDSATSSLLGRQMDEESVSIVVNIRLGGCADPTVVVGSILDHHYISRKASVVGNARLEAYGGHGGGFFQQNSSPDTNTTQYNANHSVLKWEVGAASECGVRNSNEDAYLAINNLDELIRSQGLVSFADQDFGASTQQGLYAIFDGHVGNQAARFGAEKFVSVSYALIWPRLMPIFTNAYIVLLLSSPIFSLKSKVLWQAEIQPACHRLKHGQIQYCEVHLTDWTETFATCALKTEEIGIVARQL